jgi:hypothetical protein
MAICSWQDGYQWLPSDEANIALEPTTVYVTKRSQEITRRRPACSGGMDSEGVLVVWTLLTMLIMLNLFYYMGGPGSPIPVARPPSTTLRCE